MPQSARLRTPAQVIPLPGAAAAPVINPKRGRGRLPRNVIGIWRGRLLRSQRLEREQLAECAAVREPVCSRPAPSSVSMATGEWPFSTVSRQDFDALNEGDRTYIELTMVGLTALRKAEARHD